MSQANKGIYLDKTPTEGAVERAHLKHTLAHGLAHRPELAELSHKGVYLEASLQRLCCCRYVVSVVDGVVGLNRPSSSCNVAVSLTHT